MKIILNRKYKKANYTIGEILIDNKFFCSTIEDTDRGLKDSMSIAEIKRIKIQNKTAIPTGTYKITLDVISPKFSKKSYYMNFCKGRVPRLLNVKGFEGILIHRGATEKNSAGCLIVGYNTIKGQLTNSQKAFEGLYKILKEHKDKGEELFIEIK